jgi:hypothetical protein
MMFPPGRCCSLTLLAGFVAVLAGGCPQPTTALSEAADAGGLYWVEYVDGELAVYELPRYRGETGRWTMFDQDVPGWYSGPAVYESSTDGAWVRVTAPEAKPTLDEILMLHDPPPAPLSAADAGVPAAL